MIYDINGNPIDCEGGGSGSPFTDAQCTAAFMSFMAAKCTALGMSGTTFANPSGLTANSSSTPQDEMKMGIAVTAVPQALDIWSTANRSFNVRGNHARTMNITNNVVSLYGTPLSNGGYKFLGGKGGSIYNDIVSGYHRAGVILADVDGKAVILALMVKGQTNFNNIANSAKELCDMVKASMNGQTPTEGSNLTALVSGGGGYAACVVPNVAGGYLGFVTPANLLERNNSIFSAQTVSCHPASTTKVMTMLCALELVSDQMKDLTVKTVDIVSGSGSTYYDGDIFTYHDALRIMMMESSNTLANAVARNVGGIILSH